MLSQINVNKGFFAAVAASLISVFVSAWGVGFLRQRRRKADRAKGLRIGIELGGTNFHVVVYKFSNEESNAVLEKCKKFSGTTSNRPEETIAKIADKINQLVDQLSQDFPLQNEGVYQIKFIGIASFGPLCLNSSKREFGCIMNTPKQHWRNYPLLKSVRDKFPTAIMEIDTDVNASAIAEYNHNKAQREITSLAYITVGTGVGVGIIVNDKVVHGLTHPEGGHIMVKLHCDESGYQNFSGVCSHHRNCLEGLICSEAIARRLKTTIDRLADVEDGHGVWNLVGYYLAQLCLNLTLIASPEMIVIGGGVLNRKPLLNYIHEHFVELLNDYVEHQLLNENLKDYIKLSEVIDVGCRGAVELERLQQ